MALPRELRIRDKRIQCEFVTSKGRRCRHNAESVDHFTPQALGRRWGWTEEEINAPENLQYLCDRHHKAKDKDTPLRLWVLEYQEKGELYVGLGYHDQAMKKVKLIESVKASLRDQFKKESQKQPRPKETAFRRAS